MQDAPKAVSSISYVFVAFFQVKNRILLHVVLLKCQIAFLKFTSCGNQTLEGCIPIPAEAVNLNLKS